MSHFIFYVVMYVASFFLSYVMLRLAHKYDEANMGKPSWCDILFVVTPLINTVVVFLLIFFYTITSIFNICGSVYRHFTNPIHVEDSKRTIYWLFGINYDKEQKDNSK